ncbi:MAG: hypothetical protein ACYC7A_21725 [Thermoanaerobaculia bacterium]
MNIRGILALAVGFILCVGCEDKNATSKDALGNTLSEGGRAELSILGRSSDGAGLSREAIVTMDSMMVVMDALLVLRSESVDLREFDYKTFAKVAAPTYIASLPDADGWGTPFHLDCSRECVVVSAGADRQFSVTEKELGDDEKQPVSDDLSSDIVANFMYFVRHGNAGSVQTTLATPFLVEKMTVARLGKKGSFVSVHGIVGNASGKNWPHVTAKPILECKEAPGVAIDAKEANSLQHQGDAIEPFDAKSSRPFRAVLEFDLGAIPKPCTMTAAIAFHSYEMPDQLPGTLVGALTLLGTPDPLSTAAKDGAVLRYVTGVKASMRSSVLSSATEPMYFEAEKRTGKLPFRLPRRATDDAIQEYFSRMILEDWSQADIDTAVARVESEIAEYVQTLALTPSEEATMSQFEIKQFETARRRALSELEAQ